MHAVLIAAVTALASALAAPEPPTDGNHYETATLTPQVHVIYRPDPVRVPAEGNVTVIEQANGLIVVDAGGAPLAGRRIVAKIKAISAKPVTFVIFTHWHGDHHLGAPAFRAAWPGVHFVATAATREAMIRAAVPFYADYARKFAPTGPYAARLAADPALPEAERRRWAQLAADAPLIAKAYEGAAVTLPDVTFTDRLTFADDAVPVEVMFLGRGNTDGDAVTWLPKQKVLVTGDLVVAPYPYGTKSYPAEWIAVLKKLQAYDFAWLVPGHGAIETDRGYTDSVIALLEDLRGQVDPLAAKGMSLDDVRKAVNFDKQFARFAGSDSFLHRFFDQFFVTPMIESAYHEAKGDPIVQD